MDCSTEADNIMTFVPMSDLDFGSATECDAEFDGGTTAQTNAQGVAAVVVTRPDTYNWALDPANLNKVEAADFFPAAGDACCDVNRCLGTDPAVLRITGLTIAQEATGAITNGATITQANGAIAAIFEIRGADVWATTNDATRWADGDVLQAGTSVGTGTIELVDGDEGNRIIDYFNEFGMAYYTGRDFGEVRFTPGSAEGAAGGLLASGRRYRMAFPAESFMSTADNTRLADDFSFEFFTGTYEGFKYDYVFSSNDAQCTSEGLVYNLSLPYDFPDVNAQGGFKTYKYTVCFCDEQKDSQSWPTTEPGEVETDPETYVLSDDHKCADAAAYMPVTSVLTAWQSDQCSTKCSKGCVGPRCFCDGDISETADPAMLCLSPPLCRAACDAHNNDNAEFWNLLQGGSAMRACAGIVVHEEKNACYLVDASVTAGSECAAKTAGAVAVDEDMLLFSREVGSVCTDMSDFSEYAGMLTVTRRVLLGVDYVLDPNMDQSLEVTNTPYGASLTYDDSGLSKDRITVIDCGNSCGASEPSASVSAPAEAAISSWNLLWPVNFHVDLPHRDEENQQVVPLQATTAAPAAYVNYENKYCADANLDLEPIMVTVRNLPVSLQVHSCYYKCSQNAPCEGVDCFCDGHYSGFDGPDSNALCLNEIQMRHYCDQIDTCRGFEMHRTLNRGFLNGESCNLNVNNLQTSSDYNYFVKSVDQAAQVPADDADDGPTCTSDADFEDAFGATCATYASQQWCTSTGQPGPGLALRDDCPDITAAVAACCECGGGTTRRLDGRRLQTTPVAYSSADEQSWGFSWRQILRFNGIKFSSGGTFKLCFCDSDHLSTTAQMHEGACRSKEHYSIEVGTIHVSGISCLLTDERFRRVQCRQQYYGGLRCYSPPVQPPILTPPPATTTYLLGALVEQNSNIAQLSTWCLNGPEEQTQNDARCQVVASWQATQTR